jgi:hypothetical protein
MTLSGRVRRFRLRFKGDFVLNVCRREFTRSFNLGRSLLPPDNSAAIGQLESEGKISSSSNRPFSAYFYPENDG